ncbi:serine palmitoyltransferase subunit I [Cotesia typhae]|uniref:serine palmitoyltransferase subunit I n=1 Tax=Cotesia typhae TaxID=2053667 RepID=UPI003D6894B8
MSAKFILLETIDIFGILPHYQTLLGAFVVLWLIWLFAKRRYNAASSSRHPSEEQVLAKLSTWHPEPLTTELQNLAHPSLNPRVVSSVSEKRITVDCKDCLNLGSHNYLGLLGDERIKKKAAKTVQKYGVGSCGPRGFYGTVDVHLELEERLAKYMEAEEAIVYSYGFSTLASAIPAYCKRKDIIFADEKVNFAIQKGLDATRSLVRYFKHNDVQDLERLLLEQAAVDKKDPKKASKVRRFLIVEGIYINTGLVCPLPELVKLCRKFKLRIFVDESISFGTLGKNGKGVTEHFDVPRHEVDMIMGSLEWAMGSIGGFCVGSTYVIEHQRLSGLGYCFSASLPPLLTAAAITSLDIIEEDPSILKALQNNCRAMQKMLSELKYFELSALPESPVKHLFLKNSFERAQEEELLMKISDKCIQNYLAVIPPVYLKAERELPRPSLRLCISSTLDNQDMEFVVQTLEKCSKEILD